MISAARSSRTDKYGIDPIHSEYFGNIVFTSEIPILAESAILLLSGANCKNALRVAVG